MNTSAVPRILFLMPSLDGGGAQRVVEILVRQMSYKDFEIHLGLLTQTTIKSDLFPAKVNLHLLGASRVRTGVWRLWSLIFKIKPDLILSGMFHLNFLVLLLRPILPHSTRVLVRQNGTVSAALRFGGLPWYTRGLYRLLYRRADRILCQTEAMAADMAAELHIPAQQIALLPNPIEIEVLQNAAYGPSLWSGNGPYLLSVGRLSPEKGFDLLLRAFVGVCSRFPTAHLAIAGAGPEESALRSLARELDIEQAVKFLGYVEHPENYFPGASLFVLSSHHEGMPNALLEAAAAGLPLVATPAEGGVVELLRGQAGCWLAAEVSVEALTASLLVAISNLQPEERFAHRFIEPFRMENAVRSYAELIDTVLSEAEAELE